MLEAGVGGQEGRVEGFRGVEARVVSGFGDRFEELGFGDRVDGEVVDGLVFGHWGWIVGVGVGVGRLGEHGEDGGCVVVG